MAEVVPANSLDVCEGEVFDVDGASPDVVEKDLLVCFSPLLYLRQKCRHWRGRGLDDLWSCVVGCVVLVRGCAVCACQLVWRLACGEVTVESGTDST